MASKGLSLDGNAPESSLCGPEEAEEPDYNDDEELIEHDWIVSGAVGGVSVAFECLTSGLWALLEHVLNLPTDSALLSWVLGSGAPQPQVREFANRKNFASKDSGATIIHSSRGVKNPKAVLSASTEEYLILPSCRDDQEYSMIINLSEDVAVDMVVVSNHEDFSDPLREISFFGSIDYPPDKWVPLGTIRPQAGVHLHQLNVELEESQMIRYLLVVMKGHGESELYCTLTRIM